MTNETDAVENTADDWESGKLGRDSAHVAVAPPEFAAEIDSALDLQMISIRLQRQLIEELKFVATYRGMGYQPLIREVMSRFARSELLVIAKEIHECQEARAEIQAEAKQRKTA